ncbi:hypothetical protein BDV95DRAFT_585257 [Massariosphaeria phaeospora]|uniref:FAR1 domain-containing protein n=1 Tax=Massariosphaeria phaeospora TaxID=100035 RepID=A0A7C8HZ57_9PLEO|nr:hypothetical protein BDV95DRAFT_585257 [Massariosphaeria phaeospora]
MSVLHSHSLQYAGLHTELPDSVPTYSTFSSSIHHVGPANDQAIPGYTLSSPEESHRATAQAHLDQNVLQSDPNLSPDVVAHHNLPSPSPVQVEFGTHTRPTAASRATHTPHVSTPPHIPNSAPPGGELFDMLPPPASTHPSWQALHDYAQSHASAHGYAMSINTTAKNRSRIKLACVCYGRPKNTHKLTPETRVRKNRVSYKTGCGMWVEGKRQEDGLWVLRVGVPNHNHPGRAVEGWAVQRKRTWGLQGGRIGVGGVTAKEEKERMTKDDNPLTTENQDNGLEAQICIPNSNQRTGSNLESWGLVWKIVEQEMLRKSGPGQGRDRGVGRTVKVLEDKLPGIHIFKRDVYNIRAQIKRARKAANQQIGEGLGDDDDSESEDGMELSTDKHTGQNPYNDQYDDEHDHDQNQDHQLAEIPQTYAQIDPLLVAQCNSTPNNLSQQGDSEVDRLRREVQELRRVLAQCNKELEEKNGENESLRVQVELANMALYNERGGPTH